MSDYILDEINHFLEYSFIATRLGNFILYYEHISDIQPTRSIFGGWWEAIFRSSEGTSFIELTFTLQSVETFEQVLTSLQAVAKVRRM